MPRPGIHAQSPLLRRSLAGFMLALAGAAAGPASAAPILEATSYPTLIERAATKLYSGDLDADGFGDLLIPVAEGRLSAPDDSMPPSLRRGGLRRTIKFSISVLTIAESWARSWTCRGPAASLPPRFGFEDRR